MRHDPVVGWKVSLVTVTCLFAAPAAACPTCFAGVEGGVLESYFHSTFMLSLLPFAVVGGIAALLRLLGSSPR